MAGKSVITTTSTKSWLPMQDHVMQLQETMERDLKQSVKPNTRPQYRELMAEVNYLGSRSVNSVQRGWDQTSVCKRPQDIPALCEKYVPELRRLVYLGSEYHPQLSYKRARFGGVTVDELMRHEADFIEEIGMRTDYTNSEVRAMYCTVRNGLQHNMRWDTSASATPQMRMHYNADATSRVYALCAQNGDTDLIKALLPGD